MPKLVVLIVEDEWIILMDIVEAVESAGFTVRCAGSGQEAMKLINAETVDAIAALVTDVRLGKGIDGWEVARECRKMNPDLPVIYVTRSPRRIGA